jgi:hypothetical protein
LRLAAVADFARFGAARRLRGAVALDFGRFGMAPPGAALCQRILESANAPTRVWYHVTAAATIMSAANTAGMALSSGGVSQVMASRQSAMRIAQDRRTILKVRLRTFTRAL